MYFPDSIMLPTTKSSTHDDAGDVDLISLSSKSPKADLTLQLRVTREKNKKSRNDHKERGLTTESAVAVSATTLVDYLTESLLK